MRLPPPDASPLSRAAGRERVSSPGPGPPAMDVVRPSSPDVVGELSQMNVLWMIIYWMSSVYATEGSSLVWCCVYTNAQDASSVIVEGSTSAKQSPAGTPGARRRLGMFGAIGVTERVRKFATSFS